MQRATFAAGCFWGVEEGFRELPGVCSTVVGYIGGALDEPSYHDVCSGETGHAEAVSIEFDPSRVSYEQLLARFFGLHDPTTLNRQGPDVGTQYRSAVFYHDEAQRAAALAAIDALDASGRLHGRRIVTEVVPAGRFWRAEEYHQRYLAKRGIRACHL
jgi:peptide-methionine (S)-S-oxide reductase